MKDRVQTPHQCREQWCQLSVNEVFKNLFKRVFEWSIPDTFLTKWTLHTFKFISCNYILKRRSIFLWEGKMAKSFIDVVQDSPRTSLGIPAKSKNPLSRIMLPLAEPPFGIKLHEQLVPVLSRERLFHHPFTRNPPPRPCVCSANPSPAPARRAWIFLSTPVR